MNGVSRVARFLLTGILLAAAPAASGEVWRNHFDSDAASRPPAFFDFQVLGVPGKANWMVVADHNPPSAPNQLTQTVATRPAGSIAVALRRNATLQDGTVMVSLKKLPALSGLVLRQSSEKDFLVLLIEGISGQARLTAYRDGKPVELAQGKAEIDRDWGNLVVSLAGKEIAAAWNEKPLLKGSDAKPAAGRAGLATEGPGIASFDELVITAAKPAN
jgi:hypothetical protein